MDSRAGTDALARSVGEVAVPAQSVRSQAPVSVVDGLFRRDPGLRGVVVQDPGEPPVLLSRSRLDTMLSGTYGYGRALYSRKRVAELPAHPTLLLEAAVSLPSAAEVVLARPVELRYDDVVVVHLDGALSLLPVTVLFQNLSRAFSELAMHDALTGLPNRSFLEQRIGDVPMPMGMALLYVDLDGFKEVNDLHGHRAGDELLRLFAGRLRTCVRPADVVARLGGDEFAVLLEGVTETEATVVAQRVVAAAGTIFHLQEASVTVGASVGVSRHGETADSGQRDLDALLRSADSAMYQAKASGRGRLATAAAAVLPGPRTGARDLASRLRRALDDEALQVHVQPQVDVRSGRTVGYEALARWTDPLLGVVPPDEFIPVAEATGLIVQLGRLVLGRACAAARTWLDADQDWTVSVNLSPIQLADSAVLLADVHTALRTHALPSDRLWLELTESAAVSDLQDGLHTLGELRALGLRIALDDFGTGYSSLSVLRDLPLDALKIDRSFIARVEATDADARLVRMVVQTAHDYGLVAVGEGVERPEQLAALRALGCDYAQGFYLGRPAPIAGSLVR